MRGTSEPMSPRWGDWLEQTVEESALTSGGSKQPKLDPEIGIGPPIEPIILGPIWPV
jgi:hypothetical protein